MIQTFKVNIMSRTSTCLQTLTLCLLAHAGFAAAQQPPSDKPPKLERIEPGSDVPATTIPDRARTKITEKKQGGVVTEAEVQSSGSTYTIKPNAPPGSMEPSDPNRLRPAEWKVLEFDLTKKRKSAAAVADEAAAATADVPPPPPPAKK